MGSPVAIMKLLALTLLVAVATAVPSQQWRKADPLFEHSLTTRNMFSNPLHTVFGVQAKKVLEESRQAILGKSYAPRQPYKGKRPEDCSLENMPSGDKIINGMEAADNQFPWVVYLRCNNPGWACTASMISDTWVLTAAHCVDGCTEWTVQAGSNLINGQDDSRVTIDTTVGIRHPGFNFITLHDDVAVIQLPEPVPLSDTIRVGCLPGQSQLDDQFEDDLMTLTGWGITCDNGCGQPNNMNFAKDRPIMPNDRCKQLFNNVNEGMICIDTDADTEVGENVGVCSGDSGGPLNLQEGPGQYMTSAWPPSCRARAASPRSSPTCTPGSPTTWTGSARTPASPSSPDLTRHHFTFPIRHLSKNTKLHPQRASVRLCDFQMLKMSCTI